METFQKLFEDLDVKSADMGAALDNVYQGAIDQNEVRHLYSDLIRLMVSLDK